MSTVTEDTIGCDAEGFFVSPDNKPVPVVGLLGGEKGNPLRFTGGGILEDCVAWEINPDPVKFTEGSREFVNNITTCLNKVRARAAELDLKVDISSSKLFLKKDLKTEQAMVSGCSPSYDAWELVMLDAIDLTTTNHRFASGDLHIGFPEADAGRFNRINLIRIMDSIIGMNEIVRTKKTERNKYYGQAGVHRPTDYGVEYKSIGNFWLRSEDRMEWMFHVAEECLQRLRGYADQTEGGKKELSLPWHPKTFQNIRSKWSKSDASEILGNFDIAVCPE